jgi:hypothetical protein
LRHFAKPRADEKNLARLAVALVREFGGVLEHPANSTLWPAQKLPPLASEISTAVGRCRCINIGSDTARRRQRCSI